MVRISKNGKVQGFKLGNKHGQSNKGRQMPQKFIDINRKQKLLNPTLKCKKCGVFIKSEKIHICQQISEETKNKISKSVTKTLKQLYKDGIAKCGYKKNHKINSSIERRTALSNRMKKENNPSWQGGKSFEEYGENFTYKLKRQIKLRDNLVCQLCKNKFKYIQLAVHHIDYNKKNNIAKNLICLCKSCHGKTNFKRSDWTKFFQGGINEKR